MKNILLIVVISLLSACVSTKDVPLDTLKVEQSNFNEVSLSKRTKPAFSATTPGKAFFGAIGAGLMISAGNKIIEENDVSDPANYIGTELAKLLTEKYQLPDAKRSDTIVKGHKSQAVVDAYKNMGLVVDVQTINWQFLYYPTKFGKYAVNYSAKLRLVDSTNGEQLAEGFCSRLPKYDNGAPTKDELLANSAERLKEELQIAANHCIKQLRTNILKM